MVYWLVLKMRRKLSNKLANEKAATLNQEIGELETKKHKDHRMIIFE